jgi:hypothetical protein
MPVESFICDGANGLVASASPDHDFEHASTATRPPSREEMKESSPCRAPSPQSTISAMDESEEFSPQQHTCIFFDWDDTLLSSTFLAGKGYRLDSVISHDLDALAQLRELEVSVIGLLTVAMNYGRVHIVTNAETGWVQLSAQKFIPGVVPLLSKLSVLSARSTFERDHPGNALKWKYCAFQEHLLNVFGSDEKTAKNILSFGDSHVEREAVRAATRGLVNAKTKSVKFTERPSLEQLRRQIDLIANCFHHIHTHDGDLDLQLTVTVNSDTVTDTTSSASASATSTETPAYTPAHTPVSVFGCPHPSSTSTLTPAQSTSPFAQAQYQAPHQHTPSFSQSQLTHSSPFALANPFLPPSAGRCSSHITERDSVPMPLAVVA